MAGGDWLSGVLLPCAGKRLLLRAVLVGAKGGRKAEQGTVT